MVGGVSEGYPAQEAGIRPGDRILAVDGAGVENWQEMSARIAASEGRELEIDLQRAEGETLRVTLTPKRLIEKDVQGREVERFVIGISTPPAGIPAEERVRKRYGVIVSAARSLERTYTILEVIVRSIGKMFTGAISIDNLGGPIMIAKMAADQAKEGIEDLIQFIAFMSINLGLINILPIPVLDGGHLLFLPLKA